MEFRIFSAIILLAVAGATAGLLQKLTYPQFLVKKTHLYKFTVNLTADVQGLRPQVSKAVLTGDLKIYAKTKTELVIWMENIQVSDTLTKVESSTDFIKLKPCDTLEDLLKIPIKCHYENGKVKSHTLAPNETTESRKIKKAILRNLEMYLDKKVLLPALVGRWPVSYNITKESPAGNYTALYTITSSPNPKFPQDIIVYNISRTDNYENIPYDAYKVDHNFGKQGCPQVCNREEIENNFGVGCPAGYESHQTPLKRSFFQQHDLKFAEGNTLIIDKVTTVETHVADIYDQQMEIFISSTLKFQLVTLEKASERHGQYTYMNLDDLSSEINEAEILRLMDYSNSSIISEYAKAILQDLASVVFKADLKNKNSDFLGEEVIILRKLLTFLEQIDIRYVDESVVRYNELPKAADIDVIKRQLWLDLLPLIGTKESISFIVNIIQENVNKPHKGISLWEAATLLGALPDNIRHITERTLTDLSRLLGLLNNREQPGYTVFYSASYLTLARVINKACAIDSVVIEKEEDENNNVVDELNLILLRLQQKKHKRVKQLCPQTLVERYIQDVVRKLRHTRDMAKRIIYIEFLAQTGLHQALPHLLPYVFGRVSGLTPSYVDYLKLVTVKSLHNMVDFHPLDVQHIVLPVFLNRTEAHKVRIAAFSVFIKTNPSLGILQEIVQKSWSEPSAEVGSFITSTLENYGNSSLPCYQSLAHRIKKVLPQAKRFDRGYYHSKNLLWEAFDNKRDFGASKHLLYAKSNESFIPSILYASLAYHDHSFTDLVYQYSITTQGLVANDIWDYILKFFDIPTAQKIPKNKEPVIFPKVNLVPRDPEFWRMTMHQKFYYSNIFYYLDANDVKKQKFAEFVMDYLRHYFPSDYNGNRRGHFVKLLIPSSHHLEAIGYTLSYPLRFERDNVVLLSLKLTSHKHKDKASNKLALLVEPKVHFTTLYALQILNLRDDKNLGVYQEIKRDYAQSIELELNKEHNGRLNLTYRFPSIPQKIFSFNAEAGTFSGGSFLSNFTLTLAGGLIKTTPSRFKRNKTKHISGMPPFSVDTLTENILDGFQESPKSIKETMLKFIEFFHNAGWRRKSVNITQLALKDEWSANATGSFGFQFKRIYPKTVSKQNKNLNDLFDRVKRPCFSKSMPENLEEYLKEIKLVQGSFVQGASSIQDKVSIEFKHMEQKKVISSVAVTLDYNHTLCRRLHAAQMKIKAKNRDMPKHLKADVSFTLTARGAEDVFHYNDHTYDRANTVGLIKVNFSEHEPHANFSVLLGFGLSVESINKTINRELEFPVSNEFYLPEAHEKCLEDVNKGNGYSTSCIKAIRERSIFNTLRGVIWKNNKTMPSVFISFLKKVTRALEMQFEAPFIDSSDHKDFPSIPFNVTYIDKLTDEAIIDLNIGVHKKRPPFHKRMKSPIPFPYSIFTLWETALSRVSNNSFPAICALMDKYVTTFDLKNYPLPSDAPKCTYVLATHCVKQKRFAVLAKIDPQSPGSK
ncbi:DNA-directed RNA polymerase subunit alpha, partial [Nephila pilipes]